MASGFFAKSGEGQEITQMSFKVAVVGATGNVGREMLTILEERGFPVSEVVALASRFLVRHIRRREPSPATCAAQSG